MIYFSRKGNEIHFLKHIMFDVKYTSRQKAQYMSR
jgi:hypothetical protein